MHVLTRQEVGGLVSHFVISKQGRGGRTKIPHVFTENGVAMLSSILKGKRAIRVNIQIIRTFTKLGEMIQTHEGLRRKIEAMEKKYDRQFGVVFQAIKELLKPPTALQKKIGFYSS